MRNGLDVPASPHNWAPPTPPIVKDVSMPPTVMAKDSTLTFSVTYLGDQAINLATLSNANLTASAHGYSAAAQFMSVSGSGTQVTATYSIPAPRGLFHTGSRFKFAVSMNNGQVMDTEGFPAQAGKIGNYKVRVTPRPRPPAINRISLIDRGAAIAVQFSSDVSANVNVNDLTLTSDTGDVLDASLLSVAWTAKTHTALWTFPGEPDGKLPPGKWHAALSGATIVDAIGQALTGSRRSATLSAGR